MLLYNLTFPNGDICAKQELYYRKTGGTTLDCVQKQENTSLSPISLSSGEIVSFDTYYNCFSYSQYRAHTQIENVSLSLNMQGKGIVRLYKTHSKTAIGKQYCLSQNIHHRKLYSADYDELPPPQICKTLICQQQFDFTAQDAAVLTFQLSQLDECGFVYAEVEAHSALKIFGGSYSATDIPCAQVNIGIVVCTYKREPYVRQNVARIRAFLAENQDMVEHISVFVIDNGHTLSPSDVEGAMLFENPNTGGSGGFTRGIQEVCAREQYTHFLLMDDDIVFHPEILRKTVTLLSYASNPEELCVGASMLRLDETESQCELGSAFNGLELNPCRGDYDVTKITALLGNEAESNADYTGWWYACMPVTKTAKCGLPLPFFIKYDDVEYGVRCINEIALINGIGVWHESFENKYSAHLDYYYLRNCLITDSLHTHRGALAQWKLLVKKAGITLVYQRYFALNFLFAAFDDFLKGADYFKSIDSTKLNSELMARNVKQQSLEQLIASGYTPKEIHPHPEYIPHKKERKSLKQVLSLNGYLLPTFVYPRADRQGYRTVDMTDCHPAQFFMAREVLQYNPITQTGFVTRQKRREVIKTGAKLFSMFFKLIFRYKRAAKSYVKAFPYAATQSTDATDGKI